MNWADWTFRCSDGTEYAIDAEGNVLLPEGRRITKGESFTVGLRSESDIVRIPNGVTRNPARPVHFATDDFVKMRVEAPGWHEGTDGYFLSGRQESDVNAEWFDEMVRRATVRDNEHSDRHLHGTSWRRYYVEDDEVKVEHIDPRTVYFEDVSRDPRVAHLVPDTTYFNSGNNPWNTNADPPPPYAPYRNPQTRLTRVAVAVKIALDGSVN